MKFKTVENEFGEKFYKTFARCIARDPWINGTHAMHGGAFSMGCLTSRSRGLFQPFKGQTATTGALARDRQ